jgi:hypothetical protein
MLQEIDSENNLWAEENKFTAAEEQLFYWFIDFFRLKIEYFLGARWRNFNCCLDSDAHPTNLAINSDVNFWYKFLAHFIGARVCSGVWSLSRGLLKFSPRIRRIVRCRVCVLELEGIVLPAHLRSQIAFVSHGHLEEWFIIALISERVQRLRARSRSTPDADACCLMLLIAIWCRNNCCWRGKFNAKMRYACSVANGSCPLLAQSINSF